MPVARSYVAARFAIELDGVNAGFVRSFEGGYARADVAIEKVVGDTVGRKHLAGLKYEDITITCGTGMSKVLYGWISDTLNGKYTRKDGALVGYDGTGAEVYRLTFLRAFLSEVDFPAVDASSKDTALMTIKLTPDSTQRKDGTGFKVTDPAGKQARPWVAPNFQLQIDGLDCTKVSRVEVLTVRQSTVTTDIGQKREASPTAGLIDVPNLVVTLTDAGAGTFYDWADDFLIKGNNGAAAEKNGTLTYVSSTRETFFTLTFNGLGIFQVAPDKTETGVDTVRRVQAEMYCERIAFQYSPIVVAGA